VHLYQFFPVHDKSCNYGFKIITADENVNISGGKIYAYVKVDNLLNAKLLEQNLIFLENYLL